MKALLCWTLAAVAALGGVSLAQSAAKNAGADSTKESSAREKLVGAWRLVSMEDQGADGKLNRVTDRKGVLIYTRDGHMSVQLMLPQSESSVSNDYVKDGY